MIGLGQLAKLLGAELRLSGSSSSSPSGSEARTISGATASAEMEIAGVASIQRATSETLVFAADQASFAAAMASSAAAVLVTSEIAGSDGAAAKPILLCGHPKLAFARAARLLSAACAHVSAPAIHPTAFLARGVILAGDISIGPYAVLEEGVSVGAGCFIGSGAVIGNGVVLGRDCRIYPRAVLYSGTLLGDRVVVHAGAVLGSDGFGYVRDSETGEYLQFPQQGRLVIEDDVEIGANTTIDRGALEETRIARGAKIDNLVHVGHNVSIGRNAVLAAQTGISGSSAIGEGAVLGGQVGIGDHALVGDGVILGGQAGILPHKKLFGAGILFWGTPAQPVKRYLRQLAALARLSRPKD
jgi:UDP-3-O-[3-hydroxymyristoyl] glucosamine N-acyltransferase